MAQWVKWPDVWPKRPQVDQCGPHPRIWPLSPRGTGKLTRHRTVFPHLELREQTPTCRRHRMQVAKISIGPLPTQSARCLRVPTAEDFHPFSAHKRPWTTQHVPHSPSLPNARHESIPAGPAATPNGPAWRGPVAVCMLSGVRTDIVPLATPRLRIVAPRHTTALHCETQTRTRAYSLIVTFAPRLHEGGAALSPPSPNRTSLTPNSAGSRASMMSVPAGRI